MLPGPLARLHPSFGTPHLAIALNSALIALATTLLHLKDLQCSFSTSRTCE